MSKSPKHKYYNHKSRAKRRNIEFNMTFDEWINWWGDDFDKRGVTNGSLQMCRYNDEGPYELGNIYKATREQNLKDAYKTESGNKRKEHMSKLMSGTGNAQYGKPAPNRGIPHNEETKRKIGAANSKKVQTPLGIFNSLTDACVAHNFKQTGQISGRIKRGKPGWKYL